MSLINHTTALLGTTSTTGGTATAHKSLGDTNNQMSLFLDDGAALLLQQKVVANVVQPKPSVGAPNGYTQGRAKLYFEFPHVLANSNRTVDTARLELAFDVETTDTMRTAYREAIAQWVISSDADDFFNSLAIS